MLAVSSIALTWCMLPVNGRIASPGGLIRLVDDDPYCGGKGVKRSWALGAILSPKRGLARTTAASYLMMSTRSLASFESVSADLSGRNSDAGREHVRWPASSMCGVGPKSLCLEAQIASSKTVRLAEPRGNKKGPVDICVSQWEQYCSDIRCLLPPSCCRVIYSNG